MEHTEMIYEVYDRLFGLFNTLARQALFLAIGLGLGACL